MVQSIDGRNLTEVVYKTCSKCKVSKPATALFFHRDRSQSDNLTRQCIACRTEAASKNFERDRKRCKNYYAKNKKKILEQRKNSPQNVSNNNGQKDRPKMKREAVAYLGGECQCCGFNKCFSSLQFHHRNPAEKEGDWNRMSSWNRTRREEELDKCDLLCATCHFGYHSGDVILDENGYTWKVDHPNYASMAESVDAPDLKSVDL